MGNWLFAHNEHTRLPDLSSLAADMHSHLIPGIDDGVKTLEDSLRLIRKLSSLGYKKLITTPHINSNYNNSPAIIRRGLEALREAVNKEGIPVAIEAAAEYYIEDGFEERMKREELMTFGDNYLLLEMSYYFPYPSFSQIIYDLQMAGYNIILAHVERYAYWHMKLDEFEKLKARDISLQLNFMSLHLFNPPATRKTARMLIDAGMIDFAGTDVHNDMYMSLMLRGLRNKYAARLINSAKLKNATLL
jgi:protein-tyrosine phosphatase